MSLFALINMSHPHDSTHIKYVNYYLDMKVNDCGPECKMLRQEDFRS